MLKPRPKVNVPAELLRLGYTLLCKDTSSDHAEHFQARQHQTGERVEIRVARTDVADPEQVAERMLMQWNVGRGLLHSNLIRVIDGGTFSDGRAWMAAELLGGRSLAEVFAVEAPLPPRRVLRLAQQIIEGLSVLHGRGAVHRRLRPDNMRVLEVNGSDLLKIADLGVVALAHDEFEGGRDSSGRRPMVAAHYLAPELTRGVAPDHRGDIYAFGVILYHALTGRPPFEADNPAEVMALHVEAQPPDLGALADDVPYQILDVILRCLEKDPAARPQSARAVAAELRQAQAAMDNEQSLSAALSSTAMPTLPAPDDYAEWHRLSQRLELDVLGMGGALPPSVTGVLGSVDDARIVVASRREASAMAREAADTAAGHRIEGRHRLQRRARRMQSALERYRENVRAHEDAVNAARAELRTLDEQYNESIGALRGAAGPSASRTSVVSWGSRHCTVDDLLEARTVLAAALDSAYRDLAGSADALTALCAEDVDLQRAFADQELEEQDEGFRLEQRACVTVAILIDAERALQRQVMLLLTHFIELTIHTRDVA